MRSFILLINLFCVFHIQPFAQAVDDYRSAASGNWTSAGTWERFNGMLWQPAGTPTEANGVITIRSPHLIVVNSLASGDEVIIDAGGTLTIESTFDLNDGVGNDITVNGIMNFNNGLLDSTGTILINASGAFHMTTANVKSTSAGVTITNHGTMSWQEGGINASGAFVNNNIFNITASALWQFSGGLTNNGTINKSAGTTTISTPWSNSGTINLSGGSLTSGAVFTNTGTITFSSGAAWQNNSPFNHNAGSIISGTGSFSNAGTLSLEIDLVFPATLIFSSSTTINGAGALTINNDFVILGTITGGALTLNGNGDWQGGTLGRSLTIDAGRTLLLSTAVVKTSDVGTTITNNGTMTWQEGGINGGGAVINNNILNITASALWQFSGGLTNNGTINKSAGTTNISTPWSSSGTINLSGGSLTSGAVFTNTGTIMFSSGAVWQNNSTFNHNTGSIVSGTGSFSNAGTLSLEIDQVFPATLIFSSSGTINGPGALTINNDFVIQGTITGGALTLNGNGDWQGGTLGRSLTIEAGRTLLLSTATVKTSNTGSTITNNGTMTWLEGGINGGGAVINNNILNITASALWQFSGGLTNTGTINKSAGATIISIPWSSSGTINLSGGSLTSGVGAVFTNTGTIMFSSGAVWQNNSTFNHNTGSIVSGTGSFSNAGTLSLAIDLVFPATLIFSNSSTINGPGALTINHDFVIQGSITGGPMILNGNGDWQGGTLGRSLTIDAGRTLLLSTATVKTSNAGSTITNNGTMTWQEGGINGGGAVINNNILNIDADALWQDSGGVTNNGMIIKSSAGTTTFTTSVVNSVTGTIQGIGTFSFSTLTNNGFLAPGLSPGILTVNGAAPLSASSTLQIEIQDNSGPGTGHDQLLRDGNLTLAGTLTVSETGTVPDGIYTIVTLTSGTISGNFATTNLPMGYDILVTATSVLLGKNMLFPLTLVSFTGKEMSGRTVLLQWVTTDEQNVAHFEVEHSNDGLTFVRLADVSAVNRPDGSSYSYTHTTPQPNRNYYRLRMVDIDGEFRYSPLITIHLTGTRHIDIYPTITSDLVYVHSEGDAVALLYTMSGELVLSKRVAGDDFIDISGIGPGVYLLKFDDHVVRIVIPRS